MRVRACIVVLVGLGFSIALHAQGTSTSPQQNRSPLAPNSFLPLPLGSVKPLGWLRDQLRIQADGLSGHLDEFWPDLSRNSAWLGGKGEGWERGPYYVDGLVPLAYLLGDEKLIAKAQRWIDWTLHSQRPDGGIGPEKNLDWWPNMIMLKALTQYAEATNDGRVLPFLQKYVAYQLANIKDRPLHEWAAFRWQDEVLSLVWLYNRTGDTRCLELAHILHDQGYNWKNQFDQFGYTDKVSKANADLRSHGVNNAMALKAEAVWSIVSGNKEDRDAAFRMLKELDQYHMQANGMHSGDEHYAGLNPSQGVELCAVVEAMFSYETEAAILGDPFFGDRLEKIAFNALPSTFSPDMWAHQYDQQPNQALVSLSQRDWATNGPESNLFGLEPNFGCCTANMHQGWPKFTSSLWMATPDNGVAVLAYSPSELRTRVAGNTKAYIVEQTEYPFRDSVRIKFELAAPAHFPLLLRIPGWAESAQIAVNGAAAMPNILAGKYFRIDRSWKSGDTVSIRFPMSVRLVDGYHNSLVVSRGPLVYSLAIGESWRKLKQSGPASDWEVYPTSPWNYGLVVNRADPGAAFRVEEHPITRQPFSFDTAPVVLIAKGRRLASWQLQDDSAGQLPVSPVTSKSPLEEIHLLPYGSAKLRITNFPWMDINSRSSDLAVLH